mmetsp:Transcript_12293/g.24885  ORF Transcript_12293/g.24885 Transcript_12293/m.24885 type:complete len:221 (+) Transcript_12293:768-1430(+)
MVPVTAVVNVLGADPELYTPAVQDKMKMDRLKDENNRLKEDISRLTLAASEDKDEIVRLEGEVVLLTDKSTKEHISKSLLVLPRQTCFFEEQAAKLDAEKERLEKEVARLAEDDAEKDRLANESGLLLDRNKIFGGETFGGNAPTLAHSKIEKSQDDFASRDYSTDENNACMDNNRLGTNIGEIKRTTKGPPTHDQESPSYEQSDAMEAYYRHVGNRSGA